MNIAWIGLGVMGASMARRLLEVGHTLKVYTRSAEKAEGLIEEGAVWCEHPAACAEGAERICTMLGMPEDVRQVYLGSNGLLGAVSPGAVLIDFTTSSPSFAEEIAAAFAVDGHPVLDAPVSGGDVGARNGTLSIMVGGDRPAFDRMKPLLEVLGSTIVHQGGPGAGQRTKLCNQIAIASNMLGVCEALAFARESGLDPLNVLASIEHGAAGSWSLSNLAPRILKEDWSPGFFVRHFIKDMTLALEAAQEEGIQLPGLELALERYRLLAARGGELDGTQALMKTYDNG